VGTESHPHASQTVHCILDLKAFILAEDPKNLGVPTSVAAAITIRMRVVWTTFDSCSTGAVTRLHLTDKCVHNSVEEMHGVSTLPVIEY
jgi:hypothetical protein